MAARTVLLASLTLPLALGACVSVDTYDRRAAYSECREISDKAARDVCIDRTMADARNERYEAAEEAQRRREEFEDRYARDRAMGVPEDLAGRRPSDILDDSQN
ncbi:hypothetical protein [Oceanicaulis sp. MMSF_3324]|uniref:hypothetical protein n=1 Tax=Oceanicaulis sp. MMSF_3324 TaxID=3046702 RepID=UPI00273F71A8|nr:hypothetical protein [Oceanicaulis sp. MMSF_3324]